MNTTSSLDEFAHLKDRLKERIDFWGEEICDEDVMDFSAYDLADAIQGQESFKLYRYTPASYYNIRKLKSSRFIYPPMMSSTIYTRGFHGMYLGQFHPQILVN